VDSSGTCTLLGPYLIQEWASRHFGPKLLVGLRCVNTYHMGSPDLTNGWMQTCPIDLVRGVSSTSFLEEMTPSRDLDCAPDLVPRHRHVQGDCFAYYQGYPNPILST
jgi:hypothetical protein